jgi:hypothetical protein
MTCEMRSDDLTWSEHSALTNGAWLLCSLELVQPEQMYSFNSCAI